MLPIPRGGFHGSDRWPANMQRQRVRERVGQVFWHCFASTRALRRDELLTELRARQHAMGIEPLGALERTRSLVEYREWPAAAPAGPTPDPQDSGPEDTDDMVEAFAK